MNECERQRARSTYERKQRSEVALWSISWTLEGEEEEEVEGEESEEEEEEETWRQFHLSHRSQLLRPTIQFKWESVF